MSIAKRYSPTTSARRSSRIFCEAVPDAVRVAHLAGPAGTYGIDVARIAIQDEEQTMSESGAGSPRPPNPWQCQRGFPVAGS